MKQVLLLAVLILAVVPVAAASDVAGLQPVAPKAGEQITITYDAAAAGAKLKDAAALNCEILTVPQGMAKFPFTSVPMEKEGGRWKAVFTPQEPGAVLLLFRFAAGDSIDDRSGASWSVMLRGDDGKPVPEAHYAMAAFLRGGIRSFGHPKDLAGAREQLQLERTEHPGRPGSVAVRWDLMMAIDPGAESKAQVVKEVDELLKAPELDETTMKLAIRASEMAGDSARAAEIRSKAISRAPKGMVARASSWSGCSREKDPAVKAVSMERFVEEFPAPDPVERDRYLKALVQAYLAVAQPAKAEECLKKIESVDGNFLNAIAWGELEKNRNVEQAVAWAKRGVELSRRPDPASRASYRTSSEWASSNKYMLAMVLDTYGYGLMKLGKSAEAEAAFAETYALSDGSDAESSTHYLEALTANGKFDEAIRIGLKCVRDAKDNEGLLAATRNAVARKSGSNGPYEAIDAGARRGFEEKYAAVLKERSEEMRRKVVASRVSKPSIDFTLKDLAGVPVTLSSLKGNVVVIDFWATWCGPCRSSFPYLQKVVDKYKANDRVVILAVDTWERQKDYAATVENAKKFITDNKYTFRVLIDEGMVEQYDVEGIPTKFIVDKKGKIAFVSIGFDGSSMEEELTTQIELLLGEDLGALQ